MNDLFDIVTPPPPSWMPQTAGWFVLGALLLAAMLWLAWRYVLRWHAERFRRTALKELAALRRMLDGAPGERIAVLLALAELLKRLAIAEWPRQTVAALSGPAWRDFLQSRAGKAQDAVPVLAMLINDAEYRDRAALAGLPDEQLLATFSACRVWIAGYRR